MIPVVVAAIGATPVVVVLGWVWRRFTGYVRHKGGRPPGVATAFGAFGAEGIQVSRMLGYGLASFVRGEPPPDPARGPAVVCVHGYTMNGSNFRALRAALSRAGRASQVVSLGWPGRRVADYAPRLASVLAAHPGPIDVVAHSMGGVVLRVVLRESPELAARIRRIVTLGTPHQGTAAARGWLRWLPEPADLHRRSPLLSDLPQLGELAPHAEIVTVSGVVDLVVYPPETTTCPGARHVELEVGHLGLVVDPGVARRVAAWLTGAEAPLPPDDIVPPTAGG